MIVLLFLLTIDMKGSPDAPSNLLWFFRDSWSSWRKIYYLTIGVRRWSTIELIGQIGKGILWKGCK